MALAPREASFAPIADARTRVIVLGSLPGAISLARGQYYANPTNQFWRLISAAVGLDLVALDYGARLAALLGAGGGLWDVIKSARRTGSLDASIRDHDPNLLRGQVEALPSLRAIAFNGGTASRIGRKQLGEVADISLLDLPSSSAAYCAVSFEHKAAAWMEMRRFLG